MAKFDPDAARATPVAVVEPVGVGVGVCVTFGVGVGLGEISAGRGEVN